MAFLSCTQQQESRSIDLISPSLFDTQYTHILVKDTYARAFASRDSSKSVKAVFRRGDILSVMEHDTKIQQSEETIGFIWYKVYHEGATLWLYAHDIMFCRSLPEALLFKNRLYKKE